MGFPRMLYNRDNVAVTVQNEQEYDTLHPFFNSKWDSTKGFEEISYEKAIECLGDVKKETAQEVAVRREKEEIERKSKVEDSLKYENSMSLEKEKKLNRISLQPHIKNLSSYTWHELRAVGKEIESKLGVDLPLRAKRDVIEKKITEVLEDDYSK